MAHPYGRADSGYALRPASGLVFFHHARTALVRVGVALRHAAGSCAWLDGAERSGVAGGSADVDCVRRLVLADARARNWSADGSAAVAAGAGRVQHSCVCAGASREFVVYGV